MLKNIPNCKKSIQQQRNLDHNAHHVTGILGQLFHPIKNRYP
jgi:hypothetical protein